MGKGFSSGKAKLQIQMVVMDVQHYQCIYTNELYTLKWVKMINYVLCTLPKIF